MPPPLCLDACPIDATGTAGAVALVATAGAPLLVFAVALRLAIPRAAVLALASTALSTLYHVCLAGWGCAFGAPCDLLRAFDVTAANALVVDIVLYLLEYGSRAQAIDRGGDDLARAAAAERAGQGATALLLRAQLERRLLDAPRPRAVAFFREFFFVLYLFGAAPQFVAGVDRLEPWLFTGAVLLGAALTKGVLDRGTTRWDLYDARWVAAGALLIALALAAYALDAALPYGAVHSAWHVLGPLGAAALLRSLHTHPLGAHRD